MKMRIGLFGGTFDPVHLGHVNAAICLFKKLNLDKIIMIPAFISPLKKNNKSINGNQRLAMLKIAVKEYDFLTISDYELKKHEISYSFNTINYFKKKYSDSNLLFILGSDSLIYLDQWFKINEIFNLCNIVIYNRPGYENIDEILLKSTLKKDQKKHINNNLITIRSEKISSSQIREKILLKKDITNYLSPEVYSYIMKNNLYES